MGCIVSICMYLYVSFQISTFYSKEAKMTTYETNMFLFAPSMDCLYSNHHLYLPLYLNIMRWGPTCFLGHESRPRHITRIVEGGRKVDLCSFTPLRIHPYTIFLTQEWLFDPGVKFWLSETESSNFMTTLLADASLSQLVYTFWEYHPDP